MDKTYLLPIIKKLSESNASDEAYFGIFTFGGSSDESYIHANRQGMELFASQLLQASLNTDHLLTDEKPKIHSLPINDWVDEQSATRLYYVQSLISKRKDLIADPVMETFSERIVRLGCGLALIGTLVLAIVGLVVVMRWVF